MSNNQKAAPAADTTGSGNDDSRIHFSRFVEEWQAKFQRLDDWTEAHEALMGCGFTDAELTSLAKRGLPYGKLFVLIVDLLTRGIISPGEEKEGVLEYLDYQ